MEAARNAENTLKCEVTDKVSVVEEARGGMAEEARELVVLRPYLALCSGSSETTVTTTLLQVRSTQRAGGFVVVATDILLRDKHGRDFPARLFLRILPIRRCDFLLDLALTYTNNNHP